jgi:hypothetical protein
MHRRPSLPVTPLQGTSPSERSSSSMRHIGEGVLDDSDSDESEFAGDGEDEGEETAGANSSDDYNDGANGQGVGNRVSLVGLSAPRPFPTPSPLSRVMRRRAWTEDEDGDENAESDENRSRDSDADDSDIDDGHEMFKEVNGGDDYIPSSQSTDSDSTGEDKDDDRPLQKRPRGSSNARPRRWGATHSKTRSRSSTVASLAAPPRGLTHQDSQSSIRTVTAAGGETPLRDRADEGEGGDTKDFAMRYRSQGDTTVAHTRVKSHTPLDLMLNPVAAKVAASLKNAGVGSLGGSGADKTHDKEKDRAAGKEVGDSPDRSQMTERRIESIRAEDRRFRETTLGALKTALEEFADEVIQSF